MKPEALAAHLADPTTPLMRAALREMPPKVLETLATVADQAAERAWRRVVVDRVRVLAEAQSDEGPPVVAAYFTARGQRPDSGLSVGWDPFVAALVPSEEMPDLRHTETTARAVPVGEAVRAEEDFADPKLTEALRRLAALDPPEHADILRVHLPTSRVTRIQP
ncbi:hypothetical protein [Streptomyces parvulus]